jgi:hypothetical protein
LFAVTRYFRQIQMQQEKLHSNEAVIVVHPRTQIRMGRNPTRENASTGRQDWPTEFPHAGTHSNETYETGTVVQAEL